METMSCKNVFHKIVLLPSPVCEMCFDLGKKFKHGKLSLTSEVILAFSLQKVASFVFQQIIVLQSSVVLRDVDCVTIDNFLKRNYRSKYTI